jgi:hypothetical protein
MSQPLEPLGKIREAESTRVYEIRASPPFRKLIMFEESRTFLGQQTRARVCGIDRARNVHKKW